MYRTLLRTYTKKSQLNGIILQNSSLKPEYYGERPLLPTLHLYHENKLLFRSRYTRCCDIRHAIFCEKVNDEDFHNMHLSYEFIQDVIDSETGRIAPISHVVDGVKEFRPSSSSVKWRFLHGIQGYEHFRQAKNIA